MEDKKKKKDFDPQAELEPLFQKIALNRSKVVFDGSVVRNGYYEFERETTHSVMKLVEKCKLINSAIISQEAGERDIDKFRKHTLKF